MKSIALITIFTSILFHGAFAADEMPSDEVNSETFERCILDRLRRTQERIYDLIDPDDQECIQEIKSKIIQQLAEALEMCTKVELSELRASLETEGWDTSEMTFYTPSDARMQSKSTPLSSQLGNFKTIIINTKAYDAFDQANQQISRTILKASFDLETEYELLTAFIKDSVALIMTLDFCRRNAEFIHKSRMFVKTDNDTYVLHPSSKEAIVFTGEFAKRREKELLVIRNIYDQQIVPYVQQFLLWRTASILKCPSLILENLEMHTTCIDNQAIVKELRQHLEVLTL